MNHHRCTGCKQESYPRHKWHGGVFCDSCIRMVRGFGTQRRGFFGRIWDWVTDLSQRLFQPKETWQEDRQRQDRRVIAHMKSMESKARRVSFNPQTLNPQKR